jgi:hypothetical protein
MGEGGKDLGGLKMVEVEKDIFTYVPGCINE